MNFRRSGADPRHGYDRISRFYDLIADSSEHAVRDLAVQALGVAGGERVLEIGFGTGHGLVSLAGAAGQAHGVELSWGMTTVARRRIRSAALRHVTLTIGDAHALGFRSGVFDAVFMCFALELFEEGMPDVLAEVKRVLRIGGRVGIVAMSSSRQPNTMIDLYEWLHQHWPRVIDCRPIDVLAVLQAAHFQARVIHATAIWGLPVVAAIGVKTSPCSPEDSDEL